MNSSKWIWIAAAAAGAYALYEWLSSQCETVGSSFYGGSICEKVFPSAAATVQIPTSVTPVTSVTAAQAAQLAAYGLPADAVPSSMYPSGNNCTVVNPVESGYNPTSGAPFYSPSRGQYLCGPSTLWQSMQTPAPLVQAPAGVSLPPASAALTCPPNAECSPLSLPILHSTGGVQVAGVQLGVQGLSANLIPFPLIHRRAA